MRFKILAAAALCSQFLGCISSPPVHTDPFAGLAADGPSYKNLSLALVLSDNTLKSIEYMKETEDKASKIPMAPHFDYDKPYKDVTEVLQRAFKSVARVSSSGEAKAQGADLVGILDMYLKLGKVSFATTRFEEKLILTSLDNAAIDTVEGVGEATLPFPASSLRIDEASAMASAAIAKGLFASAKLQEFSRSRAGVTREAPAAAAPAAAPAVIHSDVDRPGYSLPENPDNFAMVIGVEKYSNDLPDAQFAERDAKAVRKHLVALGYPERNIKFLVGQKATKSSIEAYLETWLARNVGENSTVFFYYSGHGAPDPVSGEAYLVPVDGNPELLQDTAYATKRLYAKLGALKAKRVIVALDSCFSGAGGRSVLAKGSRPLVNKVELGLAPGKIVALSASEGNQISGTMEEEGHGAFTYYLLKGLNGSAADGSGHVTVKGLYDYLVPKVRDAASRHNRDQTPQLFPVDASGESSRFQLK